MEHSISSGKIGIAVVVHKKEIPEYLGPDGKTYIWAKQGTEYAIVAWNMTSRRVEVVITVDGLDIIDGKTGDYRTKIGYVIPAYTKLTPIPGFRLNQDAVAHFKFGAPGNSYAALTDRPNNIGVIGAAFFLERERPVYRMPATLKSYSMFGDGGGSKGVFGFSDSLSRSASVGTEFGRETEFHTGTTSFVRESETPVAILSLFYHSRERLAELGIDVAKPKPLVAMSPNPFPATNDGCLPPAGWRRHG